MNYQEKAVRFVCHDASLSGILSTPGSVGKQGVLFIVGGPQYRVGSHRQFTLLARQFAAQGIAVMRFDYRGMGDSEGESRDFTGIDDDICAAVDCFFQHIPELNEVALWGLCDAASAALFYAHQDSRVTGLVLLNPWVRTEQGIARAYLKHYYVQRLIDVNFWKKIATGKLSILSATRSLSQQIHKLIARKNMPEMAGKDGAAPSNPESLPKKMARCLRLFKGRTLVILCSDDLTAQEFSDLTRTSPEWKKLMSSPGVTRHDLAGANHTFSQRRWREQIGRWTIDWIKA